MALQEDSLSVLLVEDNPGDVRLVERHLQRAVTDQYVGDISLCHEADLESGLETLRAEQIDVLLLDLGLPNSTGIDTLDRALETTVDVPTVVLTGLSDRDTAIEAISRGAQDYLPKDELDSDRLMRAIRYAIERHRHERALQRQTEQMDFFNQILRHDMLNGMNVILARGELLADELDGDRGRAAETIVEWSDDIIDLTETVRNILGTLTDDETRELRPVELRPIAEAAADRARSIGGTVTVDVPDGLTVRADGLLSDVLANITTNAIQHGGSTGDEAASETHIEIEANRDGNRVAVTIADDGVGIPVSQRERVFGRGNKGSASGGTGFGLYFVKSMIEAYGGTVAIQDSDLGGALFVVELPSGRPFNN